VISRDGAAGLVGLAGSAAMLLLSRQLPHNPLVPIGPAFYPRILLAVFAVLCTLLVIADLRRRGGRPAAGAPTRYRLVLLTFAIFAVYVALMPWLGFRISTFLFVFVLQAVLEPPHGRRWWAVLAVALATTVLAWAVFERYLSVLLPRGRLTDF
jgi:hypothetical protein